MAHRSIAIGDSPIKIMIFHGYVSLSDGTFADPSQILENPLVSYVEFIPTDWVGMECTTQIVLEVARCGRTR